MDVASCWWMVGRGSWKVGVSPVGWEVDRWKSKTGGRRLEVVRSWWMAGVAMKGIANLLKEQLGPMTTAVDGLGSDLSTMNARLDHMEQRLNMSDVSVDKLKSACNSMMQKAFPTMDFVDAEIREYVQDFMTKEGGKGTGDELPSTSEIVD